MSLVLTRLFASLAFGLVAPCGLLFASSFGWLGLEFSGVEDLGFPLAAWLGISACNFFLLAWRGGALGERDSEKSNLENYKLIAEMGEDAVWLAEVDPKTFKRRVVYANPEFERIWSRPFSDLQNEACICNRWVHKEDYEWLCKILERFLKGEALCDVKFRIVRPDGEIRWLWTKARRILDRKGQVRKVIGFSRDITKQKRAETALRESERNYRMLFNNSRDAIQFCSLDGKTFDANHAFEKLVGRPRGEIMGRSWEELAPEQGDSLATESALQGVISRGFSELYEKEFLRPDGTQVIASVSSSLIRSSEGEPIGIFSVARDVTHVKYQQKALVEAKVAAEAASNAKDRFLSIVSHELRTPLNPIVGYAEILLAKVEDPTLRKFLGIIKDSARGMANLVNDILDYSMIESGRIDLEIRPFRVFSVLALVAQQLEPEAKKRGNVLRTECRGREHVVLGDEQRLYQIVANLANNACKFTQDGTITLSCDLLENRKGQVSYRIEIEDTGVGIDEPNLGKIFRPFEQIGSVRKAETSGVGLGLAICRQLVQAMGGRMEVDSKRGEGTRFCVFFEFPILSEEFAEDPSPPASNSRFAKTAYRVLVVEDDETDRGLLVDRLSSFGCLVQTANDGAESLELLDQTAYDIVFMDLSMPRMNGIEAVETLRQSQSPNRDVPVVAMTAHVSEAVRKDCSRNGINDFLAKPASEEDIQTVLQRWLNRVEQES